MLYRIFFVPPIRSVCTPSFTSSLPLNELSYLAKSRISENLEPNTTVSLDAVTGKIKILASRTQYLVPVSKSKHSAVNDPNMDIFNDTSASNMWRWELISLDILPDGKKSSVKRARAVRRRLKNYQKALLKLIQSIDEYEVFLTSSTNAEDIKHRRIAKISTDEERVLKYEREEEKARLQREAKIQKDKERMQKLMEKEAEKDRKKEEVMKKQREKAKQEAEKELKKEEATKKQKARMMSFFKSTCTKEKADSSNCMGQGENPTLSLPKPSNPLLDSEKFWKSLNSGGTSGKIFSKLSCQAKNSRRRKTQKVKMRVFSSVVPDNPFEQQPFDEERTISIWNKNKFLSFHEDYRPPYHGTWSKRSDIICARNPFGKDTSHLNYDIDSEAEWEEEEDNEQADDCSVENNDDDEDLDEGGEDTTKYDYQDGWIADDGDLALEEDDEETMAMRKKKSVGSDASEKRYRPNEQIGKACVIAPLMGGLPQFDDETDCPKLVPELVEGIYLNQAHKLVSSHDAEVLSPMTTFCMEPFPPLKKSEKKSSESKSQQDSMTKKSSQEMTDEDIRTFARFVHNCTLKSKDLIVEEFRLKHIDIIARTSRAEANRKLLLIANKRRLKNGGGVIWEVKHNILESLQLHDLIVSI